MEHYYIEFMAEPLTVISLVYWRLKKELAPGRASEYIHPYEDYHRYC